MTRFLLISLIWLLSAGVRADLLLPGNFVIGDNSSNALSPTQLVEVRGGQYVPVNPIHFSLNAPLTLAEVRLENGRGLDSGVNVVIWDRFGNVVLNEQAGYLAWDRVSRPQGWQLAAGEYRMAVWGSCFNNGAYVGRYVSNCRDWDDFSFSGIRLVASGGSTAIHFIERTHIGDNTDASRWYPPAASGTYVIHTFTLERGGRLDSLTLYRLRDWAIAGGSRMFIRTAGSAYTPLVYYFDGNGDITWNIDYELSAGNYELWIETLPARDRDDISWDDIVLHVTPVDSSSDFSGLCPQAFPYPAQGRQANHYIDLGGRANEPTVGRIKGTVHGTLGYKTSGEIKGAAQAACDGVTCLPAQNTNSLTLPDSRFPLPEGPSFSVPYNTDHQLTAADGSSFGSINVAYRGSLYIRQSGVSIKRLTLNDGRGGKPYSLRLAAGDYWIEELSMDFDTAIVLDGPVRLFVKSLTMGSANLINSPAVNRRGDINQLLLVSYGSVVMDDRDTLTGLLYQMEGSNLYMGSASYIQGRVSSPQISLDQNSVIDSSGYSCQTAPATVDHYELHYGSQALTCESARVQLKACIDSSCSQLYNEGANVTLSPLQGWSVNPVSLGSAGSASLTLQRYQVGSQPLTISSSSPSAPLRCYRDGVLDSSCTLDFVDAALRFNLPTFYAGESSMSEIRAIRSSDAGATPVCLPLLTGPQSLRLGYGKVVSDAASQALPVVNGVTLPSSGADVNVDFDESGIGQLTMQYPDAGVLRLDASVQRSDGTGTLNLKGSDTVAVLPRTIVLQGEGQPVCSGSDDASYAQCPVYRKAGEGFNLLARALNSLDAATPGFAAQGLTVDWQLLAPVNGERGQLSPVTLSMAAGSGRLATSWSEVGVLRAGVTDFVPYPGYQDESPQLQVPLRWGAPIGRFVPWDFAVGNKSILPACSSFTYTGQPFTSGFTVTARNQGGGVTINYRGPFAKGASKLVAENGDLGGTLTNRIIQEPTLLWANGSAPVSSVAPNTRLSRNATPEDPLTQLAVGVQIRDGETPSVTRVADPDMRADESGDCAASGRCDAVRLGSQVLRHGRLAVRTAQGSASAPLTLRQQLEFYQGESWLINRDDSCTQLNLTGYDFTGAGQSYDAASGMLTFPEQGKIRLGLGVQAPGSGQTRVAQGETWFHLGAPGVALRVPYRVDLSRQPGAPLWLFDPDSLQGEAIFGVSRGNDRIIYRRERLN
ncbi:DUF6701 domain-containing protein [Aeromonas schubertii]|uniref:DUF6701 domain-containing protein n=1 Tax=Aeromonas schubertii TaxID=652 RepID=UPI0010A8C8D9|nr:DUF6701 domain-containing protein [Aeromonas schubertii]QCG49355.1 hypothetical protein E2P79_17330 [Aeromonas schubertii]